jgi:hypothetical protein
MIDIQYKIHDNYSVEFKIGFVVRQAIRDNYFKVNTWMFVPNSLDINPGTYGKDLFYRDVKSNVRLITPVYLLKDIVDNSAEPYLKLKDAIELMISSPIRKNVSDFVHQIKMFMAIVKSAIRNETNYILSTNLETDLGFLCNSYLQDMKNVIRRYRDLWPLINVPVLNEEVKSHFSFGDEYLSQIVNIYSLRVMKKIRLIDNKILGKMYGELSAFLNEELKYREGKYYPYIDMFDAKKNQQVLFRHGLLKKYIESDLYLKLDQKDGNLAVTQILYSIAAGLAMIFATIVSFSFQKKYGSYSIPLFVALVVSYMLKDRIKEVMRYFFVHKLKNKYFDYKSDINIKDSNVGWIKEGVDFITDEKTPEKVLKLRNRSTLLQAENDIFAEKIILYRKEVYLNQKKLSEHYGYRSSGINDIIRLHVSRMTQKMDDPEIPIDSVDENGEIYTVNGLKVYNLNLIMQLQYDGEVEYRGFRIVMSRNGISDIMELT